MARRILALSAFVALARAKAIITNQCSHPVYIWSVPGVGSASASNVPISPGGRYEERWRYGTSENPGIALKISTQQNGINTGADEVNFAYTIDPVHNHKVWVDLSPIRGKPFHDNFSFHSCRTKETSADPHPTSCQVEDNIELVLCGFDRTVSPTDTFGFKALSECFDYHHDNGKYDHFTSSKPYGSQSKTSPYQTAYATATVTTHATLTKPTTVTKHEVHTNHEIHTKLTTLTTHKTVTKPGHNHTVTYHHAPHYPSSHQYTSNVYTKPSQYTPVHSYPPPLQYTSQTYSAPYSSEPYWELPHYTTSQPYYVPYTSPAYSTPEYSTTPIYSKPPVYSEPPVYSKPPVYSSPSVYSKPPVYSSPLEYPTPAAYSSPPAYSSPHAYSTPPAYSSPSPYSAPYTSESYWSPPPYKTSEAYSVPYTSTSTSTPYWSPPYYTTSRSYYATSSTSSEHYAAPTPSYYSHSDRLYVPSRYPGDYDAPQPTGYGDEYHGRASHTICEERHGCRLPTVNGTLAHANGTTVSGGRPRIGATLNSHDYCMPQVIYPHARAFNLSKISRPFAPVRFT
jgi:hypothetical protein